MRRTGYRRGVPFRWQDGDLARPAAVVGAVLAAAVVFFAALTALWGPTETASRSGGASSFFGVPLAKKGSAASSSDSAGSSVGSNAGSSADAGDDSDDPDDTDDPDDSAGKSSAKRSKRPTSSASARRSSAKSSVNSSAKSSQAPTSTSTPPCTKHVTDEAGLWAALANAEPSDVICVRSGVGRSAPPSPTPSRSTSDGTATSSGSESTTRATPGPISSCGPDASCRQIVRHPKASTSSTKASSTTSSTKSSAESTASDSSAEGDSGSDDSAGSDGSDGSDEEPGAGTPVQENCTSNVNGVDLEEALEAASPGDRICVTGDVPGRLRITKGGTEEAAIEIIADGESVVPGITVDASNVLVEGFQVLDAEAPGIELTGNNITARNNTVRSPTGGDYDGLRFFGDNIKILHNTISDINPGGGGAHADCMQTFTSDRPSSENVIIDGNRCENVANICLMAEGPGDVGDGGGGDGTSANWTISNNYCEFGASQGIMIEAVQNVTITNNEFEGDSDKAIGLDIGSTGATVEANVLGEGIAAEVGMDSSSKKGYQGPKPQGGP